MTRLVAYIRVSTGKQARSGLGAEDDLETIIKRMIDRKRDLDEGSAEYRMIIRQLTGLRYTREEAGGIIEDPDPMGWGACRTLPAAEAPGQRPAFCRW